MPRQLIIKFGLIAVIAIDLLAIVFLAYLTVGSNSAKDPSDNELIEFSIEKGQGAREIAANLKDRGIISSDLFFNYYVWKDKSAGSMQAGKYELSPSMTISEITRKFKEGDVKVDPGIKITVPEGYRTSQIEKLLIASGLTVNPSELQEAVGISAALAHEIFGLGFLLDLPPRATIDGFLFPDTYFFKQDLQLNSIVENMLINFNEKVPDSTRIKIKARGKNLYEVVIMASLLEKEVRTLEDMKLVSGVLWKRMEIGMPLQVDATLAYITDKKTGEITNEDKLIDSPYNTYKYRGLPPTPIANPGLNAINAAIEPEVSNYLYYLSAPSGETIFSETLEEHNENKAKYLK
jgi:UPF0755 protein